MIDYYATLHVLPSAEIDVIKAAYKALARKYHPDTYDGDKAYAGKRMQEINDAFAVIGDPERRKRYDEQRDKTNREDDFSSDGLENDAQLEADWVVACKYCPAAVACFDHLSKLSRALAFAFKSYLLDSKQFSECDHIREKFRAEFLTNYFGLNPSIQSIGEKLVLAGETKAAQSVNRAVKVMGQSIDPTTLIESIESDYPTVRSRGILHNRHEPLIIPVRCPSCRWQTKVGPSLIGKRIRCKQCSGVIPVEAELASHEEVPEQQSLAYRMGRFVGKHFGTQK